MDSTTINALYDIRNAVRANPDAVNIAAALSALAEQGIDTADLDTPRAICHELTDVINCMYWDMRVLKNTEIITSAAIIATVNSVIRQRGGYREKSLLTVPREYRRAETWNSDHRVIEVLETTPDIDGYCHGCAVDIVTRSIVG